MKITHINPGTLHKNPAFSQGVLVEGGKTPYIGGQNGFLPDGSLAGNDFASQTEQAYKNVIEILKSVGASQENVVKQTIYIVGSCSVTVLRKSGHEDKPNKSCIIHSRREDDGKD